MFLKHFLWLNSHYKIPVSVSKFVNMKTCIFFIGCLYFIHCMLRFYLELWTLFCFRWYYMKKSFRVPLEFYYPKKSSFKLVPTNIYLFRVINRNPKERWEQCWKTTIKASERRTINNTLAQMFVQIDFWFLRNA